MKRSTFLWIIAIVLTLLTAIYQRLTGPSYPLSGSVLIENQKINYKLDRSHPGESDHKINIETNDPNIFGKLYWKRFKTDDAWNIQEMKYNGKSLTGILPHQPKAGKLIYKIVLSKDAKQFTIPDEPVVIRFRGDVPDVIIVPHVILIFLAMLFSTRTGLEFFNKQPVYKKLTYWTFAFLVFGGLIFGPIMQKYSFGEFWTGIPFGIDLTDNKTLIAAIGWITALIALKKSSKPQRWIIFASVLMFIIYLIPHSVLGSELDYNQLNEQKMIEQQVK